MGMGRALNRMLRTLSGWLLVLPALAIVAARPALAQEPPVTFTSTADAYVLNGAWSGTNFGDDVWLFTRTSNNQTYDSYLKFDTSGIGSVAAAKLRFNASVSANANIAVTAHSVVATGWSESAITWNNKPARGAALGAVTVTGTSFLDYEIDVTNYLIAEKAAGRHVVSFALHNGQSTNQTVWARSREAGANGPRLIITPNVRVVSLLPAVSTVALGGSTSLALTLSSAPVADTVVPIVATPAGIVTVPAQVTVPAGQTSTQVPVGTLAYGQAGITASLNGSSASAGVNVVPPPVAVTALEPATFTMTVGATSSFTVRINAAQAADTAIALAASNPSVLQVPASVAVPQGATSATFAASGLAAGNSTITATANGTSQSSSVHVSPQPAAIVSLLPSPLPLQQGATGSLTVTINVAQEVDTTIALANSAPDVATVAPSVVIAAGAVSALIPVTATSPGSTLVTAAVNGTSATASVEVTPPPPVVSAVEPATLSLPKGTPGTLRVVVSRAPNAATPVALASSDPSIASVPPQVNIPAGALFAEFPVMPNSVGQAIITASLNGGSASSTVTVSAAELVTLTLAPQAPVRFVGQAVGFTATGTMTDGASEDFTSRVTWSSSNPAVANINAAGLATALAAGETTIRAAFTYNPVQAGQPVTVEQSTLLTVQVDLAIQAVSPASGEVGSIVTLTGSGFDPVPANNQLRFQGINSTTVPASALTATPNTLMLRVPPLAESGPITLTNGRGTVQSPPFTVTREQDFHLVVSPASLTVYQGASSALQAQLSSTGTKSFTGLVTLSVQGLPAGATASFSPAATLSAFQAGTITLTVTGATAPGNYNATVQAAFTEGGVPFLRASPVTLSVAAATGVTGVKGRFVTPEGQGIPGVIVRADIATTPQPQVVTDAAGNFQLAGLPAGDLMLRFDATPANPMYPTWGSTARLVDGTITQLPQWTLTLPPPAEAFTSINNATQDQIVTDARYPGLEIRLSAGVSILGWGDNVPKTRIAVERLDPDKAPIPAPPIPTRSLYQIFWGTPMGGVPSNGQPIAVTYPNDLGLEPGTQTQFWYYDAPPGGGEGVWRQGGTGTVSADGKVIRTDPGSGIPRFCGVCGISCFLSNQGGGPPPPPPPCCPPKQTSNNRVDYVTGQELPRATDLAIPGLVPLELSRTYHPRDPYAGIAGTSLSLGFNWALSYDATLFQANGEQVRVILAGHNRTDFTRDGLGGFAAKDDPRYYGAALVPVSGGWELKHRDGRIWRFSPFGAVGVFYLTEQRDKNGNALLIARSANGRILNVQGPDRGLTFAYGPNGFVSEVTDAVGRKVKYAYNAQNVLETVTLPDNETVQYTYVGDSEFAPIPACPAPPAGLRVKTIKMPGQTALQQLHYGPSRRALREVLPNGEEVRFRYRVTGACITHVSNPSVPCSVNCPTEDSWENFQAGWRIVGGLVASTTVVDGNGNASTQRFNLSRIATEHTDNQGQQTRFVRDTRNRVVRKIDPLARVWNFAYDDAGNRTREIDPLGRTVDIAYDAKWNKPTSITRYLGGRPITVRFEYHPNSGNLIRSFDARNRETRFAYTPQGRQASVYDVALDRLTTFEYNAAGDLVLLRDPLGNETSFEPDAVGRAVRAVDPRGFERRTEYNTFDRVVRFTDPNLGLTQFNFDAKRDLRSIVNPLAKTIQAYEYDDGHRPLRRTDALLKDEAYVYDANGRLSRLTDRKGQVMDFTYDGAQRLARIDSLDGARTQRYDAAGRLVEVREPQHAIVYAYDEVDRLIRETVDSPSARTEVAFEYDALDRRTRRKVFVNGALTEETTYDYDDAGRLLTQVHVVAAGGLPTPQTVTYVWDDGDRLAERTLPNGIKQTFTYDKADRITLIEYRGAGGTLLEAVAYTYDAAGQRITRSTGSGSNPETAFTAAYDDANRLTSLSLAATGRTFAFEYDDNGNLLRKTEQGNAANITTYRWDSRNRLTEISAPGVSASFTYDALGRRLTRTVNGQTISFVYDGLQAVAELAQGSTAATLVTGLELDEALARVTQSGVLTHLTDALGSVIAQARADQSIQNYYAYSPYGEVSTQGADEGNTVQYTARESESTGLYYYRARYYDPLLKRFISEDPIGIDGGLNLYGYVGGNPVNRTDPTGQYWIWVYRLIRITVWGERIYKWVREWVDDPEPPCTGFCGGGGSFGGGGASGSWGCMADCEERKAILFKKCVEDAKYDPTEAQVCMIRYRDMCIDACKDECPPGSSGAGGAGGSSGTSGGGASGTW